MSKFRIQIHPMLPIVARSTAAISLDNVNWGTVGATIRQEYDVEYVIAGARVRYYPASIITVFSDLLEEWRLAKAQESHIMRLSGYPVLDVQFFDKSARFYYSHEFSLGSRRNPINGPFASREIVRAFASAVESVWSVIKASEVPQ